VVEVEVMDQTHLGEVVKVEWSTNKRADSSREETIGDKDNG
jgi:hypothetical protein